KSPALGGVSLFYHFLFEMGTWRTPMLGILFLMCWTATIQAEYMKYKDPNQ
ncbi:unnamed protein product, partial [Musa acuminata subsp. burmannicoides]